MNLPTNENLFAVEDSDDFGKRLAAKVKEWGSAGGAHYQNVSIAYKHLYGQDVEGVGANANQVTRSGEQDSVAELRIPAAAALLTKTWNLVVGPEFSWSTVSTTTDFASEAKALTARNALQYYWQDKGVSALAKNSAFDSLAFAEAAIHVPWNPELGEDVGIDGDQIVKTGDIDFRPVSTWDIIRDPTAKSFSSLKWVIVREYENKHDLSASCGDEDSAAACLTAGAAVQDSTGFSLTDQDSDLIPVYYLYHKRTASVPAGRQTKFLENGVVLSDEPLSRAYWNKLPVVRMAAGEYRGTPWPYSKFFSTLGAAQAADALYKDLLTNATATSGCLISDVYDSDMPIPDLGGGPKVIYRKDKNTPPPQPINLQQSHPEHFNLVNKLRSEIQQILGVDSITAGNEVGANLSGAAMALMTSTSVQNNSQLQSAWRDFVQDIGTVVLNHVHHHMKQPRKIVLAGNARSGLVQASELSSDSVSGVERVLVTMGSALQQSDAGRYQIATEMMKSGWVATPEQFQQVLDTGRLDALTQDRSNELMLITSENEALSKGENTPVMLDDDHALHLRLHKSVAASLTARRNPQVIAALQAHQDEHIRILRETEPAVLQALGQQPIAPKAQQGPANDNQLPANDNQEPAQEMQQNSAPSMPTNPETGEKAGPAAGIIPPALAIKGR